MITIKNVFFVTVIFTIVQAYGMNAEPEFAYPTDFYEDVIKNFVQEQGNFEQFIDRYYVIEIMQDFVENIAYYWSAEYYGEKFNSNGVKTFMSKYQEILHNLCDSSKYKYYRCYPEGCRIPAWVLNWGIACVSSDEWQRLERNTIIITKKDSITQVDLTRLSDDENNIVISKKIYARQHAVQEAHTIMLRLLQQ